MVYSRLQNEVPHPSAGRPAEAWGGMLCRLTPGPLRSARSSPHISGVESPDWTIGTRHAGTVGCDGVGVSIHQGCGVGVETGVGVGRSRPF